MKYKFTRKQRKTLIRIIISFVLLLIFVAVDRYISAPDWVMLILFFIPYLIVGYDVLKTAFINIIHGQVFDEKFLMMVATAGAFVVGDYPEATAVMLFYQVGELFQSIAVGKSRKSIAGLMDIRPDYAVVLREGNEETVDPSEVQAGEIIVVRPGEKIPLDGVIVEGSTSINTSSLTGESVPVEANISENVISGTLNLTSVIKVKTSGTYAESTVNKILELVENSSEKKSRIENFITRFARWYTPVVVIAALLLGIVPPIFLGISDWSVWGEWLKRACVFLVISCPCALVVSVPLSFFGGIGGASADGILIKGANYMEQLSKIDTVVLDKTGTITKGEFKVDAIHSDVRSEESLLDIAACAESYSTHPVGQSVIRAHKGHIDKNRISDIEEIAGKGLRAVIDGVTYYVGNGSLMESVGADWHDCHIQGTIVHVSQGNSYLGHIVINDEIKQESKNALTELKSMGISSVMLTGDKRSVAEHVASTVGIDDFRSELLPQDKVSEIEKILASGKVTAFVGDGINDAPVLTRADVGIAMGAMGSDAAIESADVVIMDDDLKKIPVAVRLAKRTMRISRENIVFALGVKVIILGLGALGIAGMWSAVFGDVGVLVICILNSMRTLKKSKQA